MWILNIGGLCRSALLLLELKDPNCDKTGPTQGQVSKCDCTILSIYAPNKGHPYFFLMILFFLCVWQFEKKFIEEIQMKSSNVCKGINYVHLRKNDIFPFHCHISWNKSILLLAMFRYPCLHQHWCHLS